MVDLLPFQKKGLEMADGKSRCAFYYDMGLGKTFVGAEKMCRLGEIANLVICQKSKIKDWHDHFWDNYERHFTVYDLTNPRELECFMYWYDHQDLAPHRFVGIINYDLVFRRPELAKMENFTLMLDESSLIQNETTKRSKFILNKLKPENVILLSGTPTSGKYEKLWSQLHLLGWGISKELFWRHYVDTETLMNQGFPIKVVKGYKNVEHLKAKMREYGCQFLKTSEVFDLPEQIFNTINVETTPEYREFKKKRIVTVDKKELVGDTLLTKMLYERQLCGQYCSAKLEALRDLIESTEDRLIVFYNFTEELYAIEDLCIKLNRPLAIVNGKEKDLILYEECENSITAIQYQAGSMGLNLQKANKIIYFTPTLSCENWMQSQKRTHRIGQGRTCFYYKLVCRRSIEEKIYKALERGVDYTDALFEEDEE